MRKYSAPRHPGRMLALLFPLLIALSTCLLPLLSQTTLASSSHLLATTPPAQDITRAGVAVVRLVVQYSQGTQTSGQSATLTHADTNNGLSSGQAANAVAVPVAVTCTGLGVLVGDWATTNATEKNVWILTDDALLDTGGRATCATMPSNAVLSSVTVFFSSAYSSTTATALQVNPSNISIHRDCFTQNDPQNLCTSTAVLLSFNNSALGGKLYPGLYLSAEDDRQDSAIALSRYANSLVIPDTTAQNMATNGQSYLTPFRTVFSSATANSLELGTPAVNPAGELTGMHLKEGGISSFKLKGFVAQIQPTGTNAVQDQWVEGLTAFYQQPTPDYARAQSAFQAAFQANNEFQGANTMAQMAQQLAPSSGRTATPTPPPSGGWLSSLTSNMLLSILIGVGIIPFIVLLVLLISLFSKGRSRKQRLKEDMAEAQRRSKLDAQRIAALESHPQAQPVQRFQPILVSPPVEPQPRLVLPSVNPDFAPTRRFCPRCGTSLPNDATSCTHCLLALPGTTFAFSVPSPVVERTQPEPSIMHTPEPVRNVSLPPPQPPPATPVVEEPRVLRQEEVVRLPEVELQMTERVGTRLGNYKLLGLLGSGGFAEVYLGEHRYLKTKAAIKVLHKRLDIESLISFLKEARTIANLVHPQIVRVLEFGVEGSDIDLEELEQSASSLKRGAPFLIMDYAPGGTLRRRHPKGTHVPLQNVVAYVSHVAEALDYAHQNRIIHRDIKPENMLLKQRDEVLLSDFGIAVAAHGEQSLGTQDMAGTYPYMAPEQIRGKPRPASDQYGLAVVVYEWLCGTRPFQGSQWEIIEQHLNTVPTSLCEKVPSLPRAVEPVVMRGLSKEPSQRYENVKVFARALESAIR